VPELEAWEKVYIGGANANSFLNSIHGEIECEICHSGGSPNAESVEDIHADMVRDPSAIGACDDCHADIAQANSNSLHTNLWGEKKAIELRGECEFATCAEDGFNVNCNSCHTTCGQCHVSRPNSVGGGLIRNGGHKFRKTPHISEQCTACHGSRIAFDYTGEAQGNEADVHRSRGYLCEDCHSGEEMHGDGQSQNPSGHYEGRYEVATMPRCENCHAEVEPSNSFHRKHAVADADVRLQCQVCHSQPYKNCTSCHVGNDGFTIDASTLSLKIGHNNEPNRDEYDYAVVRHAPVDQETFLNWGLSVSGYDNYPTWGYASPHNIQRWTEQTTTDGGSCGGSCHDRPGQERQGFYLRDTDLRDELGNPLLDREANRPVVITEADLH